MGTRDLVVDVLLVLAVLGALVCSVGLVAGRRTLDRLHYASAASTLPSLLIVAAVVVKKEGTQPALNAIVVAAFLLVLSSVVTHVTARLVRKHGDAG